MKRFTLFTFLYLALGVCLTAIALAYPNLPSGLQRSLFSSAGASYIAFILRLSHFGGRRRSASIVDGIQWSFYLAGDWSEHCCDGLGGSESELDNGSHFTSVFAAISCLGVCRTHCDYMASEF